MKRNILSGAMLIGVLAFASCSTQKLASNQPVDDDVYFTKAKAGEQVDMQPIAYNQNVYVDQQDDSGTYSDDDYYYYDSYASRIDRFGYNSPFNYYDDYYYDYAPATTSAYGGYGLNSYAYGGYGWGLGLGFGYGGFGYGGFYGYGGYPYWGIYSAYGYGGYYGGGYYGGGYGYGGGYRGTPRPFRGSGQPGMAANRSVRGVGYNGAYRNATSYYPGRTLNSTGGRRVSTNGYGNASGYSNGQGRQTRTTNTMPTYQPRTTNSMPSGGGGNSGGGGGGGGSRPVRQ